MKNQTQNERVKEEIKKKIKEQELKIEALTLSIKGLETIKHYKTIDKRLNKAGTNEKAYLSFTKGESWSNFSTINLYLKDRIYNQSAPDKNGVSIANYFNDYQENILIDKEGVSYQDIIKIFNDKIEHLKEQGEKLQGELKSINALIIEAQKLDDRIEDFKNDLSYTTRNAISNNCFIRFIK